MTIFWPLARLNNTKKKAVIKSAASAASAKGGCASSQLDHGLKSYAVWGGSADSRLVSGFSDCTPPYDGLPNSYIKCRFGPRQTKFTIFKSTVLGAWESNDVCSSGLCLCGATSGSCVATRCSAVVTSCAGTSACGLQSLSGWSPTIPIFLAVSATKAWNFKP